MDVELSWHVLVYYPYGKIFLRHAHSLTEINKTYLTLIPLKDNPDSVLHYTPIRLCNICYKIISTLLANRLWSIFHKIISPLQNAYVPSKDIHDNILIAHKILRSFFKKDKKEKDKRRRHGYQARQDKAYDRLE